MEDKEVGDRANPLGLCMCGRKTKIVTKSDRRHSHAMGQPFDSFMGTVARPKGRIQTDHNFAVVRFPGASKRFSGVYKYKIPLAPGATLVSNQISGHRLRRRRHFSYHPFRVIPFPRINPVPLLR